MEHQKSGLKAFRGKRGVILLVVCFIIAIGFFRSENVRSGNALREVAAELGLEVSKSGQRWRLNGRIDEIGVSVKTTTERSAGKSYQYTDFALYSPDQPYGTIVGSSLRQKVIGGFEETDWLSTGDQSFDKAVLVAGDPAEILPPLDEESRPAVQAATEAGWALDGATWKARESGHMTSAEEVRELLEVGISAVEALQASSDDLVTQSEQPTDDQASLPAESNDLSPTVTSSNAIEALSELITPRSLEAALLLARSGDSREEVRTRLMSAVYAGDRLDEVIRALGKIGGQIESVVLTSVKGAHEEAAKAAIAAIEDRL